MRNASSEGSNLQLLLVNLYDAELHAFAKTLGRRKKTCNFGWADNRNIKKWFELVIQRSKCPKASGRVLHFSGRYYQISLLKQTGRFTFDGKF